MEAMTRIEAVRRVSSLLREVAKELPPELGEFELAFLWRAAQPGLEAEPGGLVAALNYVLKLAVLKRRVGDVPSIVPSAAFIERIEMMSSDISSGVALIFERGTRHLSDSERKTSIKNGFFNYAHTVAAEKAVSARLLG